MGCQASLVKNAGNFVDVARDRQTDHCRYFSAQVGDPFQLRGLAFWYPGETDRLNIGKPKLILKDDLCAEPLHFLVPGQSLLNQALINFLSRSIALGPTFCTLQLGLPNDRQM